jgi:enoyl-[acyl-carrier protein] reductase II
LAFVRDPAIVDMIVSEGVEFVTTSAGSPDKYTSILKDAGLIVSTWSPRCGPPRRQPTPAWTVLSSMATRAPG